MAIRPGGSATCSRRSIPLAWPMPSTRPITSRSARTIDEAWNLLHAHVRHFHVKDYDTKTHRNVPAGAGDGQIPSLMHDAVADGYDGFVVLEPHLVVAELSFGFTGPERFADAATALKNILDQQAIAYG